MTPADKRISELLDRWLASIELHLKYAKLDDAAYRQVQPWPEHERPTRWILEVAQQKVLQLKSLAHLHAVQQDSSFAEALELMSFLANLVGAQNIKRFIPLADPTREKAIDQNITVSPPAPVNSIPAPATSAPPPALRRQQTAPAADESTQEMPTVSAETADSTRQMPRLEMPTKREPARPSPAKRSQNKPAPKAVAAANEPVQVQQVVIADAVRLLKWGRAWHELPDLIARMAERPGASEVRRIIKTQRGTIERQMSP